MESQKHFLNVNNKNEKHFYSMYTTAQAKSLSSRMAGPSDPRSCRGCEKHVLFSKVALLRITQHLMRMYMKVAKILMTAKMRKLCSRTLTNVKGDQSTEPASVYRGLQVNADVCSSRYSQWQSKDFLRHLEWLSERVDSKSFLLYFIGARYSIRRLSNLFI